MERSLKIDTYKYCYIIVTVFALELYDVIVLKCFPRYDATEKDTENITCK